MIVSINKNDVEHIEKVCASMDYSCRFFTNENNPLMMKAEIQWSDGVELKPSYAYHFGRMVETYVFQEMMNKHL
jgi:hypothetical protein